MQGNRMLRAGAASALSLSLCVSVASAAPPAAQPGVGLGSARSSAMTDNDHEMRIEPLQDNQMQAAAALGLTTTPQITPWEQITIHRGDTLSGALARIGLGSSTWRPLLSLQDTRALRHLRPGDTLNIRKTPTGQLAELRYKLDSVRTLTVNRDGDRLQAAIAHVPTQTREITASGTVQGSLAHSLADKGVPSRVADDMARIYRYRHDLRQLHKGDQFSVIYQATYANGEEVGIGPVVAASITSDHKIYRAFRAKGADGKYAYFDGAGHSFKPAFTRKPVAYTRISSPFNLHRMNPVTHHIRPHKGVDMAAPIGAPIHAAADGVVKYSGWMHGYGRLVELKNMDGYSTRYAHMHRIQSGLHVGEHVTKGQVIGYVGESGEATGPHLHFEIRRYGVAHNPLTIKLPNGRNLPKTRLAAYKRRIQPLIARLSPAPTTLLAKTASTPANGSACLGRNGFRNTLSEGNGSDNGILCLVRSPSVRA
ncbi:peptidoglycan DD-metalloendopeptidase family protein [Salinisphaera sp. Q1T1-3]|uniref:peptidoglycan DD-metalloendopeptidase family protein n=1 Tax=Salinisphaera sp. Q1T1-3 TaxID=2321229 RepID=UPI001314F0AC|nr:peptidoglycan DD-metalloendopeptidase family protein [Salinisphaera sp. Q1T1-3]